jgi:hypothetical protein
MGLWRLSSNPTTRAKTSTIGQTQLKMAERKRANKYNPHTVLIHK